MQDGGGIPALSSILFNYLQKYFNVMSTDQGNSFVGVKPCTIDLDLNETFIFCLGDQID